jgi:hypothetical protein
MYEGGRGGGLPWHSADTVANKKLQRLAAGEADDATDSASSGCSSSWEVLKQRWKLRHWMPAGSGKQEVLPVHQVFHKFPLKIWNANLHESCVPQQDGQLS